MSLSTSSDDVSEAGTTRRHSRRADRRTVGDTAAAENGSVGAKAGRSALTRGVFYAGIVVTGLIFLTGAWQRRWIADDGLIVLRTVRNLLAGNGPVFNAGERVETNTSAAWTYIVYAFSWLSDARLEYVVLTISLTLSVAAIALAMLGAGRLWGRSGIGSGSVLLLPAGALVYIAVPPARDYASSGLESCLVIFWLALLWVLLLRWATADRPSTTSILVVSFAAGLGPLVRPEMVLVSVLVLGLVFLAPQRKWTVRAAMVAVAGILPVGYQIWRMGYYALPYPNTAVAKDAAGAKWGQGFAYLWNLAGPYVLWLPLAILLVGAIVLARLSAAKAATQAKVKDRSPRAVWSRVQAELRSPKFVVGLFLFSGLLLTVYALRVGGDFMHGRMLLPQLFIFLLPVAVVPVPVPTAFRTSADTKSGNMAIFGVAVVVWLSTVVWASLVAFTGGSAAGTTIGKSGIVDERAFYALNTGHEHPIRASDYLDYPRMRAMIRTIDDNPNGGLLINTPSFMYWDLVPPPEPIPPGGAGHTVYFLNLGMTSMNVGLDVRVLDQMGLAYPLAAHTDRLEDGRIGHDKNLYADWVIADLAMVDMHPWMPAYFDEEWVDEAQVAVMCPETQALITSYRSELTFDRWKQNFKRALEFADYRIDRVPKYEIQRCHLTPPVATNGN